jgi:hypothetical protein
MIKYENINLRDMIEYVNLVGQFSVIEDMIQFSHIIMVLIRIMGQEHLEVN